uniref:EGF-like domain-containing protein n=1 Tax=Macrostomum lignano TaxID=282301 RepID=A0A1I8HWF1_9PLAT
STSAFLSYYRIKANNPRPPLPLPQLLPMAGGVIGPPGVSKSTRSQRSISSRISTHSPMHLAPATPRKRAVSAVPHCKKCFIEQLIDFDDAMMKCVEDVAAVRASSDCRHEPCQHGGVCTAGSLTCACPQGFVGDRCELPDPCQHSPCHPASACVVNSTSWGFQCLCPSGFVGDTCSIDVNECLSAPCANGGSCLESSCLGRGRCLPTAAGGFNCRSVMRDFEADTASIYRSRPACRQSSRNPCNSSYKAGGSPLASERLWPLFQSVGQGGVELPGPYCQGDTGECANSLGPCSPAGTLRCLRRGPSDRLSSFTCTCKPGFSGPLCHRRVDPCDSVVCLGGGRCVFDSSAGPACLCPPGRAGQHCQFIGSACDESPCRGAASTCRQVRLGGGFRCHCQPGLCGPTCAERCPTFAEARNRCREAGCDVLAGDGRCDRRCSGPACDWDGGDCGGLGARPWVNCTAMRLGLAACDSVYADGECNTVCNTEACLFDGGDCRDDRLSARAKPDSDPCPYRYCADHFADGSCDRGCDSPACLLDGGDCAEPAAAPPSQSPAAAAAPQSSSKTSADATASMWRESQLDKTAASELLELEVAASPAEASEAIRSLTRSLSRNLGTLLRLVQPPVAATVPGSADASLVRFQLDACLDAKIFSSSSAADANQDASLTDFCYRSANFAAQAVAAGVMSSRLLLPLRLRRVTSVGSGDSQLSAAGSGGGRNRSGGGGGGGGGGVIGLPAASCAVAAACLLVLGLLLGFLLSAMRRGGVVAETDGNNEAGRFRGCRRQARVTAPLSLTASPVAGDWHAASLSGSPLPLHRLQPHHYQSPAQLPVPRMAYRAQRLALGQQQQQLLLLLLLRVQQLRDRQLQDRQNRPPAGWQQSGAATTVGGSQEREVRL